MYINLLKEMKKQEVPVNIMAYLLGLSVKQFTQKIKKTDFNIDEALKIKYTLGNLPISYLFCENVS
ncbi:MAG: hypothetical protein PHV37_07435 [Candidatus Gastranaerophilales bacterium]|nr:hypothetical protein [Candidatus Gastranaerophilales bacterium]